MELLPALAISASGLTAERLRLDIIANNLANINTTRTPRGGPYRREVPVFAERLQEAMGQLPGRPSSRAPGAGVEVAAIVEDNSPPRLVYDPSHPDADANGYVHLPNINIVNEMVDMITASRAYEANVTVLNAAKAMTLKALEIGR
ncbi:flagellar basal-body rod protein FlgC [Moorella thermoacetica]|uniref:Flagellar basal-body rod protein FlgC n=3 Tax=Neomoorella thermoacetica TaxID=1525 RepID=A0A1J5NPH8_NEOTH|nr:flagellar basal body rod protein FlgC [Moorella thermoacetica]MDN5325481.1 flagellar basal-body rod protein FlgC [Moorella sp. (in: firmicutes)]AKX96165.1 flagellar basal-body rod protein FlgC [Moorella thermoacetica]OIQ09828.1 flagellar basal-body rod protein FlgC [Moorella thermoacetica]OIQ55377.1 flagellar basal-body rod protein FlgC [Moorella thermoacetica]OIQ60542.1 flagellar basal-body rod protein FlgC [Moorella thermoacetica]